MTSPYKITSPHPSINDLRNHLDAVGFKLRVKTRKLKGGVKRYFNVYSQNEDKEVSYHITLQVVRKIIREYFPDAVMTSGSIYDATFAEW